MAKKKARRKQLDLAQPDTIQPAQAGPATKMTPKQYDQELRALHGELVAMQEWVKATGAKICVVFEGRDTAGKGGTIKRITDRVSPGVFQVVALSARASGRGRRCTCSVTFRTSLPPGRWSSSTAGTTGRAWNG